MTRTIEKLENERKQEMKITEMEKAILTGIRNDDYTDNEDSTYSTWVFSAIIESKIEPKRARGVISSLVKKGLVEIAGMSTNFDDTTIEITNAGKLFCTENNIVCEAAIRNNWNVK